MNDVEPRPTPLLNSPAAAAFLGIEPQTLRLWRVRGTGPRYVRLGTSSRCRVMYRREDLQAWIEARLFVSTSAESVANQGR